MEDSIHKPNHIDAIVEAVRADQSIFISPPVPVIP